MALPADMTSILSLAIVVLAVFLIEFWRQTRRVKVLEAKMQQMELVIAKCEESRAVLLEMVMKLVRDLPTKGD